MRKLDQRLTRFLSDMPIFGQSWRRFCPTNWRRQATRYCTSLLASGRSFGSRSRFLRIVGLVVIGGLLPALVWCSAGVSSDRLSERFIGNIMRDNTEVDPTFTTYWNQVTPENSGKWERVEPIRDEMDWTRLDHIIGYAQEHDLLFKQHTFVWGSQYPDWITSLPQNEQLAEVEEWIEGYCDRYPHTDLIDVVNEPLHAVPPFKDALGGDGATGWDWVIWSFEKARQECPRAKLLLNDYDILKSDENTTTYLIVIGLLQLRGLIDGIGVQGHYIESAPLRTIARNLDRLAATGLPVYVTELDIHLADDSAQRDRYAALFPVLWEHPEVQGITLWGYKERQIWRRDGYLLRLDGSPRPAFVWLLNYLNRTGHKGIFSGSG